MTRTHLSPAPLLAAVAALALLPSPALADGILDEPLPRFEDRLCPGILGLETNYAEIMVSRIRQHAERLGMRLATEGDCEPNLVIAFVDDGRAYMADLVDRRGYLFRDMDLVDREALLATEGPAVVWHQVSPRTRDGIRIGSRDNLTEVPEAGMWQAHSRIYTPTRNDITYSLVLFDGDAVGGLTLGQLADYAVLRAFSTYYPEAAGTREASLLTLFDDDGDASEARPQGMTEYDHAWLDELYSGLPNIPASVRLRNMEIASAQ